jgi:hypothetical protein
MLAPKVSQLGGGGWVPKHFTAVFPFRWQMLKNTDIVLLLYCSGVDG